jgi:hypothetical protein
VQIIAVVLSTALSGVMLIVEELILAVPRR